MAFNLITIINNYQHFYTFPIKIGAKLDSIVNLIIKFVCNFNWCIYFIVLLDIIVTIAVVCYLIIILFLFHVCFVLFQLNVVSIYKCIFKNCGVLCHVIILFTIIIYLVVMTECLSFGDATCYEGERASK